MTCAPLLVAMRDGIRKLEAALQAEVETAQNEELGNADIGQDHTKAAKRPRVEKQDSQPGKRRQAPSKLEREAGRRLLRLASAS